MGWVLTVSIHLSNFLLDAVLTSTDVLEVNIVTAFGQTKTLNPYTDAEHFWAIRGGGGNAWGIITSITYKTHPNPTHIKTVAAQYLTNSTAARREVLKRVFRSIPAITDLGYTGYGTLDSSSPIGLIFLQPNGTDATADQVVKLLDLAGNVTGVDQQAGGFDFPSWIEYCNAFLQDPNIATNVIDPSRLLTAEVLMNRTGDLLDLLEDYPDRGAGFNFSTSALLFPFSHPIVFGFVVVTEADGTF